MAIADDGYGIVAGSPAQRVILARFVGGLVAFTLATTVETSKVSPNHRTMLLR